MNDLINFYKTIQLMNDFKVQNEFENKKGVAEIELRQLLTNFHIFEIEPNIKKALLLTKNNIMEKRNLPYPRVFLDCELNFDGFSIYGIMLYDVEQIKKIDNLDLDAKNSNGVSLNDEILFSAYGYNPNESETHDAMAHIFFQLRDETRFEAKSINKKSRDKLREFVCNFIDFINNPEVQLVKTEKTKEENAKRVSRGKTPLPPRVFIKLEGTIKKYIQDFEISDRKGYTYKFWVRGHFRVLKAERYKTSKKKLWILPYIKGKGFLIKKIYDVNN